jgi:glycerol-3-phosphate dehydrogenase
LIINSVFHWVFILIVGYLRKMMDQISYDIAIIGAGIAGASVAAALGDGVKVAW